MKVLVVNCGSSSIKYQLVETETEQWLAKGLVDRIGMSGAVITNKRSDGDNVKITGDILDHGMAIEYVLAVLLSKNHGVITDRAEIHAVGHRVAHGGEYFSSSVLITDLVLEQLKETIELAPLHNPHNIRGIMACRQHLPHAPQVAVFDTAFHQSMAPHAFLYGIPYLFYQKYKIRRYGFHGTSHFFVSNKMAESLNRSVKDLKIITCHLGNGCSMAAIDHGQSVDTTMGFTPLEGLLMGTRCGDLDPQLILYIMGKEELTLSEATTLLNKHSGLMGVSGESSDMREIENAVMEGNKRAKIAFDMFCYRVAKYIGSYTAAMNGVDVIIFTGGIGENSDMVRRTVCERLGFLGLEFDETLNTDDQKEKIISTPSSKVIVGVVPTNEEIVIAMDTSSIVQGEIPPTLRNMQRHESAQPLQ